MTETRTLFQDALLASIRRKRFALLDTQRLQHRHEKAVPLLHRVVVDHLRQQLPVREPLGWVRVDVFARDAKDSVGLGIGTLAIGIDARVFAIISAAPVTSPLITMPRMKRLASIVLKGVMKYPFVGSSRL